MGGEACQFYPVLLSVDGLIGKEQKPSLKGGLSVYLTKDFNYKVQLCTGLKPNSTLPLLEKQSYVLDVQIKNKKFSTS